MAFVPTPNVAKVDIVWTWRAQTAVNTLWFRGDSPYGVTELTDLCSGVASWLGTFHVPSLSDDVACNLIRATAQDGLTAPSVEFVPTPTIVGGSTDDSVTNNTSFVITFSTAERGRSGRGRNYIVGLPITSISGNVVDVVEAEAIRDSYGELNNEVNFANNSEHVIVSFYAGGIALAFGDPKTVIAYRYADLYIDSQRRRLPGRGS